MSIETAVLMTSTREGTTATSAGPRGRVPRSALEEFEGVYQRNFDAITRYFARRCSEPQVVADLTSETFVRAMGSFLGFDPSRGSDRAWLFGIAAHVFARHCRTSAQGREAVERLSNFRELAADEITELEDRIDAERQCAEVIGHHATLSEMDRVAVELVDLEGLSPKEAAQALGVSRIAFRKRLSRARARLKTGAR